MRCVLGVGSTIAISHIFSLQKTLFFFQIQMTIFLRILFMSITFLCIENWRFYNFCLGFFHFDFHSIVIVTVKSSVKILSFLVAFLKNMNFNKVALASCDRQKSKLHMVPGAEHF